jgi:hypothetical protein
VQTCFDRCEKFSDLAFGESAHAGSGVRSIFRRCELRVDSGDIRAAHDRDLEACAGQMLHQAADVAGIRMPVRYGRPIPVEDGGLEAACNRSRQAPGLRRSTLPTRSWSHPGEHVVSVRRESSRHRGKCPLLSV